MKRLVLILTINLLFCSIIFAQASLRTSASGGATNGTGNRTAVITPAVNDLFIVYCFVSGNTNDSPTVGDNNGGTYTMVDVANVAIAAIDHRLSIHIRNSLLPNTTSTTVTCTTGSNTSGAVHVLAITGITKTGLTAIRSTGLQSNQAAGAPNPTLNQAALTENLTITAIGSADIVISAPTNWVVAQENNINTPLISLHTATRASGFTGTAITYSDSSSTTFASHALELDAIAAINIMRHRSPIIIQ